MKLEWPDHPYPLEKRQGWALIPIINYGNAKTHENIPPYTIITFPTTRSPDTREWGTANHSINRFTAHWDRAALHGRL